MTLIRQMLTTAAANINPLPCHKAYAGPEIKED